MSSPSTTNKQQPLLSAAREKPLQQQKPSRAKNKLKFKATKNKFSGKPLPSSTSLILVYSANRYIPSFMFLLSLTHFSYQSLLFPYFLVFLPFSHFLLTIFVISRIIFEPMMPRALFGAPSLYFLGPSRHFNSAVLQSPPVQHVSEFIIIFSKTGASFCIHSVAPSFPLGTRLVNLFLSSFTCPHACFPVSGWVWSLCIWNITAFDPYPSFPPSLLMLRSVESSLRALVFPKWKKNSHVNIQAIKKKNLCVGQDWRETGQGQLLQEMYV